MQKKTKHKKLHNRGEKLTSQHKTQKYWTVWTKLKGMPTTTPVPYSQAPYKLK